MHIFYQRTAAPGPDLPFLILLRQPPPPDKDHLKMAPCIVPELTDLIAEHQALRQYLRGERNRLDLFWLQPVNQRWLVRLIDQAPYLPPAPVLLHDPGSGKQVNRIHHRHSLCGYPTDEQGTRLPGVIVNYFSTYYIGQRHHRASPNLSERLDFHTSSPGSLCSY